MNLNTLALWAASGFAGLILPAYGQIAVTDTASIVQQARDAAQQLQAATTQLEQLKAQLAQAQQQYQAVTGIRDLGGAVSALGNLGVSNPLPVNPSAVQGLLNGSGSVSGMSGSIGSLFNTASTANRAYTPTGNTWIGSEINRASSGTAGAQALALELYKSAGERQTAIEDLRCQIETATDPATRESLIAQLTAAQAAAQAQGVQAAALSNYAASAGEADRQRHDQRRQQDIDRVIAQAQGAGLGSAVTLGSSP